MAPHQRIRGTQRMMPMAGPRKVGGVGHHPGAHGVEFDMAMALEQVAVVADRACLVASFPERCRSMVAVVDMADVASSERRLDAPDLPRRSRCHRQMHRVGHQRIGVDCASFPMRDLTQVLQVPDMVDCGGQ